MANTLQGGYLRLEVCLANKIWMASADRDTRRSGMIVGGTNKTHLVTTEFDPASVKAEPGVRLLYNLIQVSLEAHCIEHCANGVLACTAARLSGAERRCRLCLASDISGASPSLTLNLKTMVTHKRIQSTLICTQNTTSHKPSALHTSYCASLNQLLP